MNTNNTVIDAINIIKIAVVQEGKKKENVLIRQDILHSHAKTTHSILPDTLQTVKGYCGHVAIKVHFIVLMFETLSTFDHHKL